MKAKITAAIAASLIYIVASEAKSPSEIVPLTTLMITEVQNGSLVSVRGTWTIPEARTHGESIADPINAVHIWCQKSTHECFEAYARVQNGEYLTAELNPYDVTAWTKQEITAETSGLCAHIDGHNQFVDTGSLPYHPQWRRVTERVQGYVHLDTSEETDDRKAR